MADIQPFHASRFSARHNDELAKLLTPPYDVISPQMQEQLYYEHPKNIVRIDFGREDPGDGTTENKYTRAAAAWKDWTTDGTIVRDAKRSIYVYEQEFEIPGLGSRKRRGFFAAVRLEDFGEAGGIRAHEHTFAGPKADRLNLMRATHCNMSPIFCIYDDPERVADKVIAQAIQDRKPIQANIDGIVHRLWLIDEHQPIEEIIAAMKHHRLYIADGHHRYETSLNYRNEQREKTGKLDGEEPFDFTLMFLANTHDEGLEILPTHRVLSPPSCENVHVERALKKLSENFEIVDLEEDLSDPHKASLDLVQRLAEAGRNSISFILLLPENPPRLLTMHDNADLDAMIPDKNLAKAVKKLDVTILHSYIIDRVWLGKPEVQLGDADIAYLKDAFEVIQSVQSSKCGAGFLLNPTRIEQVIEIAGLGMRMPHKSTYFYPKIITGLVIRDMENQ